MKTKVLFCMMFFFALFSCKKEVINPETKKDLPDEEAKLLKASVNSVDFDWENSDYININGVSVALPWYSGAQTAIPQEIILDHKKDQGWVLVYNTIDYIYHTTKLNYLVFYNILTGRVRFFYYAINPSGNNSIWRLQLNGGSTSLLNSLSNFPEPISKKYSNPFCQNSNLIEGNTTSGIYPGWNCFELEFAYDPSLASSGIQKTFSLRSDSYNVTNITLNGTFNSQTAGEIILPGTSNPFSSFANSFAKKTGDVAAGWVTDKMNAGNLKVSKTLLTKLISGVSGLTGELVQSGLAGVFKSFLGKYNTSKPTIQKVNLHTEGKFDALGTLQSSAPDPSAAPLGGLLIPGSITSGYNGLLPTLNSSNIGWGAWNLESAPVVKYSKKASLREWLNEYEALYAQDYYIDPSSLKLKLNPALASSISNYELSYELWYYKEYANSTTWNGSWTKTRFCIEYSVFGNLIYSDSQNQFYRNSYHIWYKRPDHHGSPSILNMAGYDNRFVVKVYLKIYPKAPYSTDPIVMTRSYIPAYVGY